MPYPQEYQIATLVFQEFLINVRNNAEFGSSHMAYTTTQGVFQVFRRRISLENSIVFCNLLPAAIRALFVADWNPAEKILNFESREKMIKEVMNVRPDHNFSYMVDDPINEVSKALQNYVDQEKFKSLLDSFPKGAFDFWYYHE